MHTLKGRLKRSIVTFEPFQSLFSFLPMSFCWLSAPLRKCRALSSFSIDVMFAQDPIELDWCAGNMQVDVCIL